MNILWGIIAAIIISPAVSWGQFSIVESGYPFENPGFLATAGVMAYDSGRHRLAISDQARETIFIFDLTDKSFQAIDSDNRIMSPAGLAFDRTGVIYITQQDYPVILRIGPDFNILDSIVLDEIFTDDISPGRIAIGAQGNLFVSDIKHRAVCQFDTSGRFINKIREKLKRPDGIFVNLSGEIYIADKGIDPILQFSAGGKFMRNLSRPEDPTGQSSYSASGLAFDQRGWLYTLDITHNQVVRLDPTGVSLEEWAPEPPFFPKDIVIDKYGNIYISESGLGRVLIIGIG
ncbi:MAG: hypothetical protein A2W25_07700 [candidate division Zixibacteria bacterium RBG_16_53_22]|nr:MAG: hypothetical protein A2W25_07700 [candidate division Zixibacteria bacterium RBG_16_53_22]